MFRGKQFRSIFRAGRVFKLGVPLSRVRTTLALGCKDGRRIGRQLLCCVMMAISGDTENFVLS